MPVFDLHMIFAIVGIALVGGLIGLDQTAVGQFMISQPIVAGPLTGWLLGDPVSGLIIGAVLELLWVLDMPIGSFVPADATISAVSATAIAALGNTGDAPLPIIGFSILLTTAMTPVTMKANSIIRHWNSRLADAVMTDPVLDVRRTLALAHFSGLPVFFMKSFVLYLVFLPIGIGAVFVFGQLPENIHRAMSLFVKLLPLVGVALVARKLSVKAIDLFLLGGFIIAVTGWFLSVPAISIMLLTVTAGWLGTRYSERRS
jgi:PTS system mannose-specific IIC component